MSDGNFECKVERRSETNKGVFITLLVNPADLTPELQSVRVGAKLMIGWAEIVNTDVEPIETIPVAQLEERTKPITAVPSGQGNRWDCEAAGSSPAGVAKKPRTPFHELRPSQQAGMLCKDTNFLAFLALREEKAEPGGVYTTQDAEQYVRGFCGIESRAQLDSEFNFCARQSWVSLRDAFESWKLTQKYAETIR